MQKQVTALDLEVGFVCPDAGRLRVIYLAGDFVLAEEFFELEITNYLPLVAIDDESMSVTKYSIGVDCGHEFSLVIHDHLMRRVDEFILPDDLLLAIGVEAIQNSFTDAAEFRF